MAIKYDIGITVTSPGNNANCTARVSYFGVVGGERIEQSFEELSGSTIEEATENATKAVQDWISQHEILGSE